MNKHIGTTLDSLFEETGELEDVNLRAQKKGLADAVRARMEKLQMSKASLAKRMGTSRSQLERLLDPNNTSVTLATLAKASAVLGLTLDVSLSTRSRRKRDRGLLAAG